MQVISDWGSLEHVTFLVEAKTDMQQGHFGRFYEISKKSANVYPSNLAFFMAVMKTYHSLILGWNIPDIQAT